MHTQHTVIQTLTHEHKYINAVNRIQWLCYVVFFLPDIYQPLWQLDYLLIAYKYPSSLTLTEAAQLVLSFLFSFSLTLPYFLNDMSPQWLQVTCLLPQTPPVYLTRYSSRRLASIFIGWTIFFWIFICPRRVRPGTRRSCSPHECRNSPFSPQTKHGAAHFIAVASYFSENTDSLWIPMAFLFPGNRIDNAM